MENLESLDTCIRNTVNNFEKIDLKDTGRVKLLKRKDSKYLLNKTKLLNVLNKLAGSYFILSIDSEVFQPYTTTYFDTDNFGMYTSHQNGKLNRYKIRKRTYNRSGQKYVEVKFKNNKKHTIKKREKDTGGNNYFNEKASAFIKEHTPFKPSDIKKKLTIHYTRFTLVDLNFRERVTIDVNMEYRNDLSKKKINGLVIIELKQDIAHKESKIKNILKAEKVYPQSLSKYCLGIASLYDNVKKNRMKKIFLYIDKLISGRMYKLN